MKIAVVMGVANNRSIAWGIANKLIDEGYTCVFTYPNDSVKKKITRLSPMAHVIKCDVSDPMEVRNAFIQIKQHYPKIDYVVHAMSMTDFRELDGNMMNISRINFLYSMEVGVYSLIDIVRHSLPMMNKGGAYLTLSYDGSRRVYDNYNVMGLVKASLETATRYLARDCAEAGVRVNCISAGVIKTSSAMAVKGSKGMLKWAEGVNPMKRNITLQDIAGSAYYFLSDLSSGVTGETHYVDCGYNIIGAPSINDI